MNTEINYIHYDRFNVDKFNTLFTFLNSTSSLLTYNIKYIQKLSKSFYKIIYKDDVIKYYKFIYQHKYNKESDILTLEKKIKFKSDVTFKEINISCEELIQNIFNIPDTIYLVKNSTNDIETYKIKYVKDYFNILKGISPYGYQYKIHIELPQLEKLVNNDIEKLEKYIKQQEDYLKRLKLDLKNLYNKQKEIQK